LTPCWCHFFRFIYWLWTETVVVDQVLLWFRPTLILSRIPDQSITSYLTVIDFLLWSHHFSLFTFTHTLCPVVAVFWSTSMKVNEFNGFNDLCQTASVNDIDCWNKTLFTNNFVFIVSYCCYYFTLISRFNSFAALSLPCRKARRRAGFVGITVRW